MCCQITPKWVVGSKGKPSNIQGFWAQIYLYFEFFLFGQISARTLTAHSLRSSHPHPFRTPCAHPHSVWVCCAQPHKYSGREKSKKGKKREKKIHFQSSNRPAKDSRTHHRAAHNKEVVTTVYWPCGRDLLPSFPRLLEWRRPSGGAALVAVFI